MQPALYLTIDGVLDHLGFSQVLRVIEGLAQRGQPYALVSMERARDLKNIKRVDYVRNRLADAGIEWTWEPYAEGSGGKQAVVNIARFARIARGVARRLQPRLVHARGYHGALVAETLRATLGLPYIFDARGLWIDERLEERRWFTTRPRLAIARAVERRLYGDAAAVVTLTQLHADDVTKMRGRSDVTVIPTCADYDEFRPRDPSSLTKVPREIVENLAGRRVLGIVGSLNRAYLGGVAAKLTKKVLQRDPEARLLVLSAQSDAWRHCLEEAGVPLDRVVLTRADHEAVPEWLSLVTWGLLLLTDDTAAKRAMMPTKLAEFFAVGVRPVVHGCSTEVRDWVRRAGSGLVLHDVTDTSLSNAADAMVADRDPASLVSARGLTADHFSLPSGIARYERLLRSLG